MTLMKALAPLRRWMVENNMSPDQAQISLAPDDFATLVHILARDMRITGELSGLPITFMGFKISAKYDNRLPVRTVGGDD